MQNTFLGEVTIRKTGYQTKSVKGATGYTMPIRPQSFDNMSSQEEKQISQQIMFIPFPEIRNVIVTFLKPYPEVGSEQSQILISEYKQNKELRMIDEQMREKIRIGYHQKSKLEKILKCFDKAEGLKDKVTRLKKKIREAQEKDVTETIKEIERHARDQRNRASSSQQKQKFEQEKNSAIIEQLLANEKTYSELNAHFIDLDATYAEVNEFCKEMQKVVPIVWRVEGIPETTQKIDSDNFISYFKKTILDLFQLLSGFIHSSEAWLQLFRNQVKSRSWSSETQSSLTPYQTKLKEFISTHSALELTIKQKVYQKLKELTKLDQHIVRNLPSETAFNMKAYEGFVETYTDIKEVVNTKNQWEEFERIISDEERYLSEHMKLNCGLVVYYKPTRVFEEFANAIVKRTYVLQLFSNRLTPIRNAIKYINEDYSGMYKRACEDNYSRSKLRKNEVRKVLEMFQGDFKSLVGLQQYKDGMGRNEKVHAEYVGHLIESLNRLMALASE